ncbi:MAG TPA: tetratricopeptide repeat protein [Verrucomicrobiae bacterium]|nr:tetratricopeptide repeat protein [Verrucomicrobiae bacterium]
MSRPRFIGLLLALLTLAVYLPVARHGFILYDDGDYVTENPMVRNGLTLAGIKWAFTTFHSANWHPITWLSHMVDCQLFGLNPAGPHCVNALLHASNTVLVFALWLQLLRRRPETGTNISPDDNGAIWQAAFIAALFAVHPLHVESVAWIAERKDILSTFFGLLALGCYVRYARGKWESFSSSSSSSSSNKSSSSSLNAAIANPQSAIRNPQWVYGLALVFFALGLMSKPMLVTWPFVMLLLDYWPLHRFIASGAATPSTLQRVVVEKIPFFALTAASCIITYIAQNQGAVRSLAAVPLVYRLENVPVAIATYLFKLIWPVRLAVIYPMPHAIPGATFIGCSVFLIAITAGVWLARKQQPFLVVGWFWFFGTLVPVIGLVKVGDAAMADRYMYIPSIGIFMIVAFGAQRIWEHFSLPKIFLCPAAAAILVALTVVTEKQLQYWSSDEALFGHAVRVTSDNVDAMLNYGVALENGGKPVAAIDQYRRAQQLAPSSYLTCVNLADLLYYTGQTNAALEEYLQAVKLRPDSSTLHDRLGTVLSGLDDFGEATNEYWRAISLDKTDSAPHLHLGTALAKHDDWQDATDEFSQAMRLSPGDSTPLVEWAKALLHRGRDAEAMDQLNKALQMDPDNYQTLTFAARVLASDKRPEIRNGGKALDLAKRADALTGGRQPLAQDVLGMALAENRQFDQAQMAATSAIRMAKAAGMNREIVGEMRERLELYREDKPWRERSDF